MKKLFRKLKTSSKEKVERSARTKLIEELFYDFNRNRHQVYLMNFVRGIAFGVGSVIGGTVIVAILVGLLSLFTDIPGGIGNFVQSIVNSVNSSS